MTRIIAAFVGVFLFGWVSLGSTTAQPTNTNICTANIDQLNGQSRFSLTGLSRFSLTGLEGGNATFEESDLPPELKPLYEEVIANPITPLWMNQFLQPIIAGEVVLPIRPEKTAILIVDDFADRQISSSGLPSAWIQQMEDLYGFVPDNLTVQTHGDMVNYVAESLVDRLGSTGFADLNNLYSNLVVVPVDISIDGVYRLDILNSQLKAAIEEWQGYGYNRFVVNMSFGLVPCTVPSDGNFAPFDYQNYLSQRNQAAIEYYRFDVDYSPRPVGRQSEFQPVVYNGYGLADYLIDTYYDDVSDPIQQEALVNEHLEFIFRGGNNGDRQSDPALVQLRQLLKGYLEQSAATNTFALIPIVASGNYADILPDAPLEPASFPEVIAVGAQLGMKHESPEWQFSQPSHLLAPGAWFELYNADSFVAGTSFAAPYASVIASMYAAYRDTCYFGTGQPPLKSFDYLETVLHSSSNPFNCSFSKDSGPTPTPTITETPQTTPTPDGTAVATFTPTPTVTEMPGTNLLVNGGFETRDNAAKPVLAPWTVKRNSADKIKCNKYSTDPNFPDKIFSHSGECAFVFKGSIGESSVIVQSPDVNGLTFEVGDTLNFSMFMRGGNTTSGKVKVRVKYTDDTATGKITLNLLPAFDYTELPDSLTLSSANVGKIKVQIQNTSSSGKLAVDDVRLMHNNTSSLIGLP